VTDRLLVDPAHLEQQRDPPPRRPALRLDLLELVAQQRLLGLEPGGDGLEVIADVSVLPVLALVLLAKVQREGVEERDEIGKRVDPIRVRRLQAV
jgi:hypothetical protein